MARFTIKYIFLFVISVFTMFCVSSDNTAAAWQIRASNDSLVIGEFQATSFENDTIYYKGKIYNRDGVLIEIAKFDMKFVAYEKNTHQKITEWTTDVWSSMVGRRIPQGAVGNCNCTLTSSALKNVKDIIIELEDYDFVVHRRGIAF
ncbi:hypothetical protein [Anaerovibrio lipolyticus]|uniref:hypothetical protein n=1 Tax=Anaerovibrio lipolyticus TaxID=82374 RepID=UPI0025CF412F|nr:hypothetical protein [Anaerovibrio lipolyticus]